MIDDEDITYYNGKEIARGSGFATLRKYTIPAGEVKPGKELSQFVYLISGEKVVFVKTETLYAEMGGQKISLESGTIASD